MSTEIPIWVNGEIRWLSGIDKKTTCKDVIEVLLDGEGIDKSEMKDFTIMERWRKVERPLDENSKILKIWSHWGYEKKEVRLCLRRIDNEVDSGRGSPIGSGSIPSTRRKRNRLRGNGKPPWTHSETLHPRRLAELGRSVYDDCYVRKAKENEPAEGYGLDQTQGTYDEIYSNDPAVACRKKSNHKSYHCPSTGRLHSTLISEYGTTKCHTKKTKCCSKRESKHKTRNSENIEKLMKLILAQGATIQSQLQKLKERDEQIESIEQERHRERLEKNGRNYLLETYLGSLKEAEIPAEMDEERAEDSGVNTEVGSDQLKQNAERLNRPDGEVDSDLNEKLDGDRGHPDGIRTGQGDLETRPHRGYHKRAARSKSESRCLEGEVGDTSEDNCKSVVRLKRTLSDSSIGPVRDVAEDGRVESNAKDDSDEIVELQRIQSQIEMWEKVFRINKKLEKEEENLVRLHIKIKKCQNENYRFAKETEESPYSSGGPTTTDPATTDDGTVDEDIENLNEMRRSLQTLKSDLDQNSKEIYENFTRLLEDDETVERKRDCLTKLISDLERTHLEEDMLHEMIEARARSNPPSGAHQYECVQDLSYPENGLPEFPPPGLQHTVPDPYDLPHGNVSQSGHPPADDDPEKVQTVKPKNVKISFQDTVQSCDTGTTVSREGQEKSPVPAGALKGILKNRRATQRTADPDYSCDLTEPQQQPCTTPSPNYEPNGNYYSSPYYGTGNTTYSGCDVPLQNVYSYSSHYPYHQPLRDSNTNLYATTRLPNHHDLKTAYSTAGTRPQPQTNLFPHEAMVKAKGTILNDNDSSTSSDTSGLCSMYSSSPSVEQSYCSSGYILDTLV